jgi:hypothetical protein
LGTYPPYGCHVFSGELLGLLPPVLLAVCAGWYGARAGVTDTGAALLFGSYPP